MPQAELDGNISLITSANSKTVVMHFNSSKMVVYAILAIGLILFSAALLLSDTWKVNGVKQTVPLGQRFIWLAIVFACCFLIGFIYSRLQNRLTKNSDGSLDIWQHGFFFSSQTSIPSESAPYLYAEQKRMIGTSIYFGTLPYRTFVKYSAGGGEKQVDLVFAATIFMRGAGPRGALTKAQVESISRELGLRAVFA